MAIFGPPPKNWQKWPKKHKKKSEKTEKNVVYDIVKFQFFQKWPFLTPLKTPKNDPFFGPFSSGPNLEPKMTAFWPIFKKPQKRGFWGVPNSGLPLGVLVQKSPFLVKIGVFGTLKWPVFDHLLDPPWIPLVHSNSPLRMFLKKWQKGVQKLVQKVTPKNVPLFGHPQKWRNIKNDIFPKNRFFPKNPFLTIFGQFLVHFLVPLFDPSRRV